MSDTWSGNTENLSLIAADTEQIGADKLKEARWHFLQLVNGGAQALIPRWGVAPHKTACNGWTVWGRKEEMDKKIPFQYYQIGTGTLAIPPLNAQQRGSLPSCVWDQHAHSAPNATEQHCGASLSSGTSVCSSLLRGAWSQILLTQKSTMKFTHTTLGTRGLFCYVLNALPTAVYEGW